MDSVTSCMYVALDIFADLLSATIATLPETLHSNPPAELFLSVPLTVNVVKVADWFVGEAEIYIGVPDVTYTGLAVTFVLVSPFRYTVRVVFSTVVRVTEYTTTLGKLAAYAVVFPAI